MKAFVDRNAKRPRSGVLVVVDKILCRTSCLLGSGSWGYPVFAPTDSVNETNGGFVEFEGRCGFVFIHCPLDRTPHASPPGED